MSEVWTPETPEFPVAAAVDMDSPVAISHGLGLIENEIANLAPRLTRAAYWRKKLKASVERNRKRAFQIAPEGTIPEKHAHAEKALVDDPAHELLKLEEAEAQYAAYDKQFDTLDTRRSILQSALKVHVREQEPRHGEGSHHK